MGLIHTSAAGGASEFDSFLWITKQKEQTLNDFLHHVWKNIH